MTLGKHCCAATPGANRCRSDRAGRHPFFTRICRSIFPGHPASGKKTQCSSVSHNAHSYSYPAEPIVWIGAGRSPRIAWRKLRAKLPDCVAARHWRESSGRLSAHDIGNHPMVTLAKPLSATWGFTSPTSAAAGAIDRRPTLDFSHFEANAQGFRVLTSWKYHQFEGAMR